MIDYKAINQRLYAPEVISYLGLSMTRSGFIHCPVHNDKHPSMKVYKHSVYCFSCGAHFDIIGLTAHIKNVSQSEAVKMLCEAFSLPFVVPLHAMQKTTPARTIDITVKMVSLWCSSLKRLLTLYVRKQAQRGIFCDWAEEILDDGLVMTDGDFFNAYTYDWRTTWLTRKTA